MIKRKYIDIAILTALSVIICRSLLLIDGLPWGADTLGLISRVVFLTKNYRWLYLWRPVSFGFIDQIVLLDLFLASLYALSGYSESLTVSLFIFTTFLIAGFSMYELTYHCTKQRNASLLASIIFILNQPFLSQFAAGHLTITLGYALAPLLFLLYDKALKVGKLKDAIFASIMLSVFITLSHPLSVYMFGSLLVLFALSYVLSQRGARARKNALKRLIKIFIISGFFSFLLLAFNFVPLLFGVRPIYLSTRYTIEEARTYSVMSLWDAFVLKVSGATQAELGYIVFSHTKQFEFPSPYTSLIVLCIPILAYSAIFLRKNRYTIFFTASALLSAFIAKGPYPPFGEVFLWLYNNFPGFAAFRAANRWLMVTAFSYSLLISISVNEISSRLMSKQKIALTKFVNTVTIKSVLKKITKRFDLILTSLIILAAIFSSWYCVFYGLQTYQPPKSYTKPFEWISKQPGDFRVLTLPYRLVWTRYPGEAGFGHDFGLESFMYHDRPVVGIGGLSYMSQDFVDFTYGLVLASGTDNIMKILGAFNVKYLVAQEYSSWNERYFFDSQKGLQPVFVYENSTIYENEFWTPHLFVASKYAIVVGGREAFTALTTVDTFNLSNWGLLFADQIADQLGVDQLLELLKGAHLLIFVNSEPLDFAMLALEDAIRIRATDYAYPSSDASKHWINEGKWTSMGTSVQNRYLLSTSGNLSVSMPINVEENEQYDLWIRLFHAPDRGNLSITIDGTAVGSIVSHSTQHYSGLKWVKIGPTWLRQGRHELVLTNKWALGKHNDVDEILLVQPQHLKSAINQLTTLLQTSPIRIINIIEGEQMFKWVTTPRSYAWWAAKWPLPFDTSGGYAASTAEATAWMPLILFIPRDGQYGIAVRATSGPRNGTLDLVVNEEHTRHVKLTPLEIREVNPTIIIDDGQTTFWENLNPGQVTLDNDKDNKISGDDSLKINVHTPGRVLWSLLEKTYYPMEDWNEDKYITFWFKGASSNATFSVYIYFDGSPDNYAAYNFVDTFPAWRRLVFPLSAPVAAGGTIDWSKVWRIKFAIEDRDVTGKFQIDRMARAHELVVEKAFDWVTLQPLALEATNNTIELYANNEVDLDQMVIYSLNPGEENATLEDIFKIDQNQTTVSYKKINPTRYIAHVKTDTPFLLVFSDAYHNLWKAYVNGEEIRSIPAYSFINAFYITETGEYDITIEFIGQRYVVYGGIISIATIILITIYLAFNVKINRLIVKKLKLKKGNEK